MGTFLVIPGRDIPKGPSVYAIACADAEGVYVGSSVDVAKRIREHWLALGRNRHHSRLLQSLWNSFGPASLYVVVIARPSSENLVRVEQAFIEAAIASGTCLNARRRAVKPRGPRRAGPDWSAQPWATETNVAIAARLGLPHVTVARHRPAGTPSPACSLEWRQEIGRKSQAVQSLERLRASARKAHAKRSPEQHAAITRLMRAGITPESRRKVWETRRRNQLQGAIQ